MEGMIWLLKNAFSMLLHVHSENQGTHTRVLWAFRIATHW